MAKPKRPTRTSALAHCEGKARHASYALAVAGLRRQFTRRGRISPYKCPACGFWHVGHWRPKWAPKREADGDAYADE